MGEPQLGGQLGTTEALVGVQILVKMGLSPAGRC
jgi:hypothetical protein